MATKPRARTEDEQVELTACAVILAFDILGANTLQRIRVIWKLSDKAFTDLHSQVQRELAGETMHNPPLDSERAFRCGLQRALLQLKPKRPSNRRDVRALREYQRAKQVFETGMVELGLNPAARRYADTAKRLQSSTDVTNPSEDC